VIEVKVLIVQPYMSVYGGAELVIVKLANYLTKKGIKNSILTLLLAPEIKQDLKGTTIFLPEEKITEEKNFITTALMLRKYFNKISKDFDIINIHNFPAELAVINSSKPVVWMCNEPPRMYFGLSFLARNACKIVEFLDKHILTKTISRVIVSDNFNARRFEKIYGIKPVINNYGVDYGFFSKGSAQRARKTFNLTKNDFILLHVGMLTPFKNQMESVKTVERLKTRIPNVKLVLAGHGGNEYESVLRKYVHEKGLDNYVTFTGHLPRTLIRDLYKACDVALFPIKSQGGWLSPFEALCAGTPIIISSEMTPADIIKKKRLGTVTDDFANAVINAYENLEVYKKRAKEAKVWVKKNLTWNRFCENMTKVFKDKLSHR
jgi:glycosyltransferase involved in cell wall biosynthesis